jgi:hypothetical protein
VGLIVGIDKVVGLVAGIDKVLELHGWLLEL